MTTAQNLYDFRRFSEICSGQDLADFFLTEVGEPCPSGKVTIDRDHAIDFFEGCARALIHNNIP